MAQQIGTGTIWKLLYSHLLISKLGLLTGGSTWALHVASGCSRMAVRFQEQASRDNVLEKKSSKKKGRNCKTFSDLVQKSVVKFYWFNCIPLVTGRQTKPGARGGELGSKHWWAYGKTTLQKSMQDGRCCCSHLWKYRLPRKQRPMEGTFGSSPHEELQRV